MYNHELTLIKHEIVKDNIGNEVKKNEVKKPISRKVLCRVKDIGSSEFYKAKTADLKPLKKFVIHLVEYEGERLVSFNGKEYEVMRTFAGKTVDNSDNALDFEEIELTCTSVIGNG